MRGRKTRFYPVVISQEGRWFVARCTNPAVTSQGRKQQEALRNIREAIELYLESFGTDELPRSTTAPIMTHVEVRVS